jgi:hypothetical protein
MKYYFIQQQEVVFDYTVYDTVTGQECHSKAHVPESPLYFMRNKHVH